MRLFAGVSHSVAIQVFCRNNRHIAKLKEAAPNFLPGRRSTVPKRDKQQETQHEHELKGHHGFDGVVDLAAHAQGMTAAIRIPQDNQVKSRLSAGSEGSGISFRIIAPVVMAAFEAR